MFDTTKVRPPAGTASAFVVPRELPGSQANNWSRAGAAVELAYRAPAPASHPLRVAIALDLVVAAKLCWAGVLQ